VQNPVPGRLARVVVRWFQNADPLYLTIHALGTDEESGLEDGDAWYPLEWPNVDREIERWDRIVADPAVQAAGHAVADEYAELDDMDAGEWRASPALIEVARRAPEALRAAGVEAADHMLVLAAHFEGGGALRVLQEIRPSERVVAALRRRDELPDY
jgi:hypothetical protein